MGAVTEIVSLLVCILVGIITAACMLPFEVSDEWPSQNMTDRGTKTNFLCGIPIAFFSGLGVAVGLLDSQTNSLVGVAISASLLPPAVNAGMFWVVEAHDHYVAEDGKYGVQGTISLGLTVMNIVVIIIASMFMFRLKEVRFIHFNTSCWLWIPNFGEKFSSSCTHAPLSLLLFTTNYFLNNFIVIFHRRSRLKRVSSGRTSE